MAKKPIRVTAAMAAEAEPRFSQLVAAKLQKMGATNGAKRFRADAPVRKRLSKRYYQKFLNQGGKVGDWKAFAEWLLEHWDEIVAAIAKLLPLFV